MKRQISQRELRNDGGKVPRGVAAGDAVTVTSHGVPDAELVSDESIGRRRFVTAEALVAAFRDAPLVDADALRKDLDSYIDEDPTPRA